VARDDATGEKRLIAYVAVGAQKPLAVDQLREFLKQKLPDYMVPSLFMFLEALPLTPNGKVDRKALPLPEQPDETTQKQCVGPRNSVENRLVKIWESVLGVRRVGVQENFFELGGHSLLVAKLLRRIEHVFGQKLSMAAIFEAPTIEQQASLLNNKETQSWPSAVVPVQPCGSREPLFCFGFGAGPIFRSLALRLGKDQPLLGIDPMLLEGTQVGPPYAMEDIAACLAQQIRDIQRDGPYHLGGICGGGLVAYETARNLLEQGQQVGLLALIEPHSSYYDYFVEHARGVGLNLLKQRLRFHWSNLRGLQSKEARSYIRDHIRERGRVLLGTVNGRLQKTRNALNPKREDRRPRNIRNILGEAYRDYRPQPFAGRVALFQATHREPGDHWERAGWENLASQISVHEVPGYSNWIVRFFVEPSVGILADILKRYLPGQRVG
jgi:thioesterase domain-containing protein